LYLVPNALRERGLTVHTLDSLYGPSRSQRVRDTEWLQRAGEEGWIVLCKDDAIRRNPLELEIIERVEVKVFCLTTARLPGYAQRDRIISHLNRILQRALKPGPYVYGIYENGLRLLWRPA
jgi:hypothetical protein